MDTTYLSESLHHAAHEVLVWVGFGTLAGLAAKALMPGRDPGGAVGTMLMGIAGCVIGCGSLLFFNSEARISPISGWGFVAATGGAFVLLLFYRILGGYFFVESEGDGTMRRTTRRRRRSSLRDAA